MNQIRLPTVTNSQTPPHSHAILFLSNSRGLTVEKKIRKKKKAFVSTGDCVACGCCLKVCPRNAIEIWKGIMAKIDMNACIGCGKCAKECPASVIVIQEADA